MYLKSLSLQGFKSFANRTELSFFPGITAVVGPNGSGKSNISDAIRWVLGEQSLRALRGLRMQDIIFSGSDLRRPLGLAEVSLTIDNSTHILPVEFSEVTVTRRVFRSGESEFFINRTPCRLRDIQSLFLDSGMGRGTFSIIGQGEIDAVLSASSEDRRLLLEDAAGIARYRTRKEEALEKLAETAENLLRVNDVITEVTERLGPLERAAQSARKHQVMSARQSELELGLFGHEWSRLDRLRQAEKEKHATATASVNSSAARLLALEKEMLTSESALEKAMEAVESVRNEMQKAKEAGQQAAHIAEMGRQRFSQLEKDELRLGQQFTQAQAQKSRLALELVAARSRQAQLSTSGDQAAAAAAAAATGVASAQTALHAATEMCDKLRALHAAAQTAAARWEGELRNSSDVAADASARRRRLSEDKATHTEKVGAAQAAYENNRITLEQEQAALKSLRQNISAAQELISAYRAQQAHLQKLLTDHNRTFNEVSSRRKVLAAMAESYDGYYQGTRSVLAARHRFGAGIIGPVGELLRAPAHLETAIETALGSAVQNIVTMQEADAEAAIAYLKETKSGRATFLPLNALHYQSFNAADLQLLDQPGVLGIAAQLVTCESQVQGAIDYLLGRTVITEKLHTALAVAKKLRSFQRIVTLDGDVVTPGGAITGGSVAGSRNSGILSRQRELAELQDEMETATVQGSQLEADLAEASRLCLAQEQTQAALTSESRRLELTIAAKERDLAAAAATWQELSAAEARLLQEEKALNDKERSWSEHLAAATKEISATKEAQADLGQKLQNTLEEVEKHSAALQAEQAKLAEARVARAEVSQAITSAQKDLSRLDTLEKEALHLVADTEAQLAVIITEKEKIAGEVEAAAVAATASKDKYSQTEAALSQARQTAETHRHSVATCVETERQVRHEKDEAQERLHRCEVALERLETAIAAIEERLAEREAEPVNPGQAFDAGAARREIEHLRQELAELGPVNHGALAELAEVQERHQFLCAQRDDLMAAKSSLDETIAEIDQTSTKRLRATFDSVRSSFKEIFRELFGGGDADLSWTDEAHPLQSGLELVAQPPGKKLQSLMMLSGGERALTAISFLFAIVAVRSSPFCMLDEIDAALDEQNVTRFAHMLSRYAAQTQFIVITHRQPTMENADTLYGVSMDRAAASTLVSLRLSDLGDWTTS